ncbi:MAG TPA: polysaccharide pyruvyl transferase family protein, partial [Methylobacter sp.]
GHHVTFRDFRYGKPRHIGQKVKRTSLLGKIAKIPQVISDFEGFQKRRAFRSEFNKNYKQTCWPLLNVPQEPDYELTADIMVIGSDEVFNYTQNHPFGYVPCLFGHEINAPLILSYAASAGFANWDDVIADGMAEELGTGLGRMKYISVRDENTRLLVEHCTGSSPTLVIDPTLIVDFDDLIPQNPVIDYDYILVYAYEGRLDSDPEIRAITDFAAMHKLKIISVGDYHAWCDENFILSPFEMLRVFKDASYVVTDTFHGSIFAMKNGRQFATFVRDHNPLGSNSNKVRYLLHQLGMESRLVNDLSNMSDILTTPAPYDVFNQRLLGLRKTSLDFLTMALA